MSQEASGGVVLRPQEALATDIYVARGLRRSCFTAARGSCDRYLCRKRPPEELFYGRKRLLRPIFMPQEASGGVVLRPQEALATGTYAARGLRRSCFTAARGSCDRHLCRKRPPEEL